MFILGYDPLIRFIDASLGPVDHLLLPFCDDLALACSSVSACWVWLALFVSCEVVLALGICIDVKLSTDQMLQDHRWGDWPV